VPGREPAVAVIAGPAPDLSACLAAFVVIAEEIVECLSAALDLLSAVAADLSRTVKTRGADGEANAVSELLPDEEHRI
jgi:hypothetical protein